MKKSLLIILISILSYSCGLYAQDDQLDDLQFETEDAKPESTGYFAVAGGYTATYNILNMDDLNSLAKNKFNLTNLKTPFFSNGFEIFTGSIIVKNLNVGFFSNSGNTLTELDSGSINRSMDYQISTRGFIVDYGFVPYKSLAILPGFQLGFANSKISIDQTGKNIDWENIDNKETDNAYSHKLEKSFLNLEPRLSIQYAVTNFLMFRANASYTVSVKNPFIKEDWIYNNSADAKNVPDKINQSGFKFQLGIFVGLMNF